MHYGYLSAVPAESFVDSEHSLSASERFDRLSDYSLENSLLAEVSNWNWMTVVDAIKRDEEFVVEASSTSQTALLRFSLRNPEVGAYELTSRSTKKIERGTTHRFTSIQASESDSRFKKIMACATKFVVITTSSEVPVVKRAWILGLESFKEFEKDT